MLPAALRLGCDASRDTRPKLPLAAVALGAVVIEKADLPDLRKRRRYDAACFSGPQRQLTLSGRFATKHRGVVEQFQALSSLKRRPKMQNWAHGAVVIQDLTDMFHFLAAVQMASRGSKGAWLRHETQWLRMIARMFAHASQPLRPHKGVETLQGRVSGKGTRFSLHPWQL